jgi:hypothetical protein
MTVAQIATTMLAFIKWLLMNMRQDGQWRGSSPTRMCTKDNIRSSAQYAEASVGGRTDHPHMHVSTSRTSYPLPPRITVRKSGGKAALRARSRGYGRSGYLGLLMSCLGRSAEAAVNGAERPDNQIGSLSSRV